MDRFKDISKENLAERAKELECLYLIDEAFTGQNTSEILQKIAEIIPTGFRDMKSCTAVIVLNGKSYATKQITDECDKVSVDIILDGEICGYIQVMYPKNTFENNDVVFLPQEIRLLSTIAGRISENIYRNSAKNIRREWETIIKLLQRTDLKMLLYVCEKMLTTLAKKSPELLADIFNEMEWTKYKIQGEINFPLETLPEIDAIKLSEVIFASAGTYLKDAQIYDYISLWIYQGKTYELVKIVNQNDYDVRDIAKSLNQYVKAVEGNEMSSVSTKRWLTVELIRRFLTDNPKIITNIQKYLSVEAFCELLDVFICSPKSNGKIGGKGTGFFIANQIIKSYAEKNTEFSNFKVPRTWFISSDEIVNLIESNNYDELKEHKYQDILDIRTSYPRIIQAMKNAKLSPYIINQLDQVLDVCNDKPLIVRSSSLLEDQAESAFSGKYKSLFLTNTGDKNQRRNQLVMGILEIYASMYNPDSIQYRKKRDMIDCLEQMGVMIQEVVGNRVGPYYFPLYAGVALSNNELRWSHRIKREDGILRMVMGLGTRAVDRVGEDFPILISPGQPNLRVNQTPSDVKKYSPQLIDVIDLEKNRFVTISISDLIKECGDEIPYLNYAASVYKDNFISESNRITTDFKSEEIIITFDGLIKKTPILKQIQSVLSLLKDKLGYPVDVEFASDGKDFYLLQCRAQSRNHDSAPVAIPANIPLKDTVFTANRYISNGKVSGIKTVIYVDPAEYSKLERYDDLMGTANAISELNRILPRRSFILMGPGRWGSRGDIKMGVPVTYSDINNSAMLIEIAQTESKNQPDLSFGTHFFQDLVEENIKYLPLYPQDDGVIFHKSFFERENALSSILPMYSHLSDVIKVVQVGEIFLGKELYILMNADLEKAVAYIDDPIDTDAVLDTMPTSVDFEEDKNQGWRWRHFMAEQIAEKMDMLSLGVKGIYLFGSTNNCMAKLNSDIDLLIHFNGSEDQKQKLDTWLSGWSMALSEMNFLKTGYKTNGLLDIHYVTDEDIKNKNSYAIKINSVYDPATPLKLRKN